jgi:hypothetical protein
MATQYLEELLYMFLKATLTDEEKKALSCSWDVEEHIDEETENELKDQIYASVKSSVRWATLIRRIQDDVEETDDDDEEEEDAEDEGSD